MKSRSAMVETSDGTMMAACAASSGRQQDDELRRQ